MPDVIDVSGLPEAVVHDIRQLVSTLRTRWGTEGGSTQPAETTAEWVTRLSAWIAEHPKRVVELDDSRESIYSQ